MALTIQQRKDRRLGIGGSDIAALFGVPNNEISKWATPLDIYLEKLSTEEPAEELIGEDAILECKTADKFLGFLWEKGDDNVPEPYLLQCAYYAEILNVSKVYIAVLIGGNDFRVYHYDRNHALGKIILSKVIEFWEEHVLKQIPPGPINQQDAIKRWLNTASDEVKVVTDEILKVLEELRLLKTDKGNIEAQLNLKQLALYNFMQDAQVINSLNGDAVVTWKKQSSKRFDAKRFMIEHPEMYALYIKTSETRVLRIKGDKNE